MDRKRPIGRRDFLRGTAALGVAWGVLGRTPARGFGEEKRPSASNRLTVGCIGLGGNGSGHLRTFLAMAETQVLAVCDVEQSRRDQARSLVESQYGEAARGGTYRGCTAHNDFRELIARNDIDIVVVSTPDHWHALPVIAAAKAGKHIYCEKPLALTVEEGRVMSDTVRRYGVVFQTGSQLRSSEGTRRACELVRNGCIGKLHTIRVGTPRSRTMANQPETPVPPGFDYDMWLGPAPWEPYTPARCHGTFRFILDYSGGEITDHGAHYIDIGQWGHGSALSGPVEIEGEASAECQQFFCRQLAVIGSASEVPALARLLADKTLREQARCALQTIPGDEAEVALLQALTTTDATLRVGIINSLGARRAKRAIGPLTSLLNNSQPSVADAAADALGAIGGADAARVLRRGLNATDMSLRRRICRAAVVCADGLVKQADREVLLQLYEALYEKGEPRSTRVAAFLGMVRAFPGASLRGMVENLKGNDPELRAAALRAVREVQGPPITAAVCGAFGELAPPQQALLLRALADRRAPRGIAAAESGLKSPDADVRIGALQLVAVLGNEEYLEKLAELAATSTGAEQAAAREALARLPGTEVDPRIASQLDAKTAVRADSRRHAKSAGRLEGGEHATRRRIRNEPGSANPTGDSPRTAEACRGKERIAS